jgi:hypothetical protein
MEKWQTRLKGKQGNNADRKAGASLRKCGTGRWTHFGCSVRQDRDADKRGSPGHFGALQYFSSGVIT